MKSFRNPSVKKWDDMGHDITKLSPQLQSELANYRRLLLAKDDFSITTEEEQAAFWKCINVAKKHDGLPSPFAWCIKMKTR